MKEIIKCFLLVITIFIFNLSCVYSSELDVTVINSLKKELNNNTLIIYTENNKLHKFQDSGLLPLMNYVKKSSLKNSYVFDKVIGKAAAFLYVYADADYVYAKVISKPAIKVFRKYDISYEAEIVIDEIINRKGTDICPFEKLVKSVDNPEQAYGLIYKKLFIKNEF